MTYDDPNRHHGAPGPDAWGLKPGNNKQPFKVVAPADAQPTLQPEPTPRDKTDLEHIAAWVRVLTYADMKALAAGVLGKDDQAEIIVLADKLHAWAAAPRAAA